MEGCQNGILIGGAKMGVPKWRGAKMGGAKMGVGRSGSVPGGHRRRPPTMQRTSRRSGQPRAFLPPGYAPRANHRNGFGALAPQTERCAHPRSKGVPAPSRQWNLFPGEEVPKLGMPIHFHHNTLTCIPLSLSGVFFKAIRRISGLSFQAEGMWRGLENGPNMISPLQR